MLASGGIAPVWVFRLAANQLLKDLQGTLGIGLGQSVGPLRRMDGRAVLEGPKQVEAKPHPSWMVGRQVG